jgi:TatD DNase family protein
LDFYIENPDKVRQEKFFIEQMRLAEKYSLPVSVHARRALFRVMAIIKQFPQVKGVIHAFPGSKEEARQVVDLGWKIGVGGAVT